MNMNAKKETTTEILTHEKGTKLIALILAVITWYAIQPTISFEQTITDVPVRILLDSGWAVLEQSVSAVDIDFRGSREGLRNLQADDVSMVVDARGLSPGEAVTLPLLTRDVQSPAGVRAVFVRPGEITLNIDQETDRDLPVRVQVQGAPPDGYVVEQIAAEPAKITVRGPRQRLDQIEDIRTVPIDMQGRLQSFKLQVDLIPPSRAWTARLAPERVEVDVQLTEQTARKILEALPVKTLWGAHQWHRNHITPDTVNVEVVGRPDRLEALTLDEIRVYVDMQGIGATELTHTKNVRVHLPADVRLGDVQPGTVEVEVEAAPAEHSE